MYPTLQTWLDLNNAADRGLLLVLMIVLCGVSWLAISRALLPRFMPSIRILIATLYTITGVILMAIAFLIKAHT